MIYQKIFYCIWSIVGILVIVLSGILLLTSIKIYEFTVTANEWLEQIIESGILEDLLRSF